MPDVRNTPPHAEISLTLETHGGTMINAQIQGCKECLAAAIAICLLQNKDFKDLINTAVRIANDRRAQKEN